MDDLRVFAYGGTSFRERLRYGDWPQIPISVLEDYFGIRGGLPWFGFCVAQNRPFLLWKELRNPESRGGYPLVLLLDPGFEFFERMNWNTAWILSHLFEEADGMGRWFLDNPENATPEDLRQVLARVPPPSPRTAGHMTGQDGPLVWAAGLLEREPVVAPPSALGCSSRPRPSDVVRVQAALAPGVRNSRGWVVGASRQHAIYLGAQVAIDDQADSPEANLLKSGSELLSALSAFDELQPWARSLLPDFRKEQAWCVSAAELQLVRERIGYALECGKGDTTRLPELIDFGRTRASNTEANWLEPLASELQTTKRRLTPEETDFLLTEAIDGRELSSAVIRRMDHRALSSHLNSEQIPPSEPPRNLQLPTDIWVARWAERLNGARDHAPELLTTARRQLREAGATEDEQHHLDEAAVRATADLDLSLWRTHASRASVAIRLRDEARRRIASGGTNWGEYFEFGHDPKLTWLRHEVGSQNISKAQIESLCSFLADQHESHAEAIDGLWPWQIDVAIPAALRVRLAKTRIGRWKLLDATYLLLSGRLTDSLHLLRRTDLTSEDRQILQDEIRAIMSHQVNNMHAAPCLAGIEDFIGKLDHSTIETMRALRPALGVNEAATRDWLKGWSRHDPQKHDDELLRWIAQDLLLERIPQPAEDDFSDNSIVQLVGEVLCGDIARYAEAGSLSFERTPAQVAAFCLGKWWWSSPQWRRNRRLKQAFATVLTQTPDLGTIVDRIKSDADSWKLFRSMIDKEQKMRVNNASLISALAGEGELLSADELKQTIEDVGGAFQSQVAKILESPEMRRTVSNRLARSAEHLRIVLGGLSQEQQFALLESVAAARVFDPELKVDEMLAELEEFDGLPFASRALASYLLSETGAPALEKLRRTRRRRGWFSSFVRLFGRQ